MGRNKAISREQLLSRLISFRITEALFKKLEKLHDNSNCSSVGEVARRILSQEKITIINRDDSMNAVMEELASIRKELRSIGININQITHRFHISDTDGQRVFNAMRAAEQYKAVGEKVDILLEAISKMAVKWLQ